MSSSNVTLREDEIRPDHLMQEQSRRFEADIARLLERRSEFVQVACPACGSESSRLVFQKYTLDFVVCSACETIYMNPRPSPALLEMYYSTSENYAYWNKHIFPESEGARRQKIFRPRARRVTEICRRYGVPTRTLLEVGAGFGTFCEEMRAVGAFEQVIAVEPNPGLAESCRRRGIDVIEKPIEHVKLEQGHADVIASFEVLEHLFCPRDYVEKCAKLLQPGGMFIATCPNVQGFDIVVLRELSATVDAEHLNYFHPESLSLLVRSCGFDVLEVQTPGKLDAELVRKKVMSGEFDLGDQRFLRQVLVDKWEQVGATFQEFLASSQLSSHMWLVARKKG
jgi:2-polyprenyl-3-methyl-5-hydroxy-6-metoxy-1,4-benzoquinol methylase/ribosomal protein S27E